MMSRSFTLFTGQWADLPLEEVCRLAKQWGYDGLELACWGDHFEVDRALGEEGYLAGRHELLAKYDLRCWAISNHLVGQAVCDHPIDIRHQGILPARIWGDGEPEGVRQRAAAEMADTARAAKAFGVDTVVGFTGSSIWHTVAMFPPAPASMIDEGYADFARRWNPILDVFDASGVRFAHEVHPSEIAYDFWTTKRALEAVDHRSAFGLNFDPSHFVWQDLDPVAFLDEYSDRIYHVDCKEARKRLDGRNGRLGSHLPWGDPHRGWDFVSAGRGDVQWEDVFRMLNSIGYRGPISVEWEDAGMDRLAGAPEALAYLRRFDLEPPQASFDAAFSSSLRSGLWTSPMTMPGTARLSCSCTDTRSTGPCGRLSSPRSATASGLSSPTCAATGKARSPQGPSPWPSWPGTSGNCWTGRASKGRHWSG
jgi:sugar phosphate isomerase/epimerase